MDFRNYTFDININDSLLEMEPGEYSFSLRDNIFDLFPILNFEINDPTGLLSEYLLFTPGVNIDIAYGLADSTLKNNFIIDYSEVPEQQSIGYINGNIKVKAKHSFLNLQEKISYSYTGNPTNIVSELISPFTFYKTHLESSVNNRTWYRPLQTQKDFIEQILLENVYSNSSNDTPFFCFIDNNNEFHFESFFTMMNKPPIEELVLEAGTVDNFSPNMILSFLPFWETYSHINKNLTKNFYTYNKSDFSFNTEEFSITEIQPGTFPVVKDTKLISDYEYYSDKYELPFEYDQMGRKLFSFRDSLLVQKCLVTVPLNVKLTAGKTVNLSISAETEDKSSISYSGKYLIERSDHTWNKNTQTGYTQVIVGRKNNELPNNYLLKEKFYTP